MTDAPRPKRTFTLNRKGITTTAMILTHKQLAALSQLPSPVMIAWEQKDPDTGKREDGGILPELGSLVIKPGLHVEAKAISVHS